MKKGIYRLRIVFSLAGNNLYRIYCYSWLCLLTARLYLKSTQIATTVAIATVVTYTVITYYCYRSLYTIATGAYILLLQ